MKRALWAGAMMLLLVLGGLTPPATAAPDTGPPLTTAPQTLAAALSCSTDVATNSRAPILLVPGTITTAEQAWSWGYQRDLRAQGYPVCTVSLPNEGTGDMQVTVEYVVNAVRQIHADSGKKVSMIGHSQGGLLIGWALRFWPDVAAVVDDAVALDSPFSGGVQLGTVCSVTQSCPALVCQISKNSLWSRAMTRLPVGPGPSVTSISAGAGTDLIPPQSTVLSGATNLTIQDLCPGRRSGHVQMLADSAAYALTMDALTHPGPASLARTSTAACARADFAGVDQSRKQTTLLILDDVIRETLQATWVPREPALRDYALGRTGDVNLSRGRPVSASSTQACCGDYRAANAVDGDLGTRWASAYWVDPSWLAVDLGGLRTVSGIQVTWEGAYARSYQVQVNTGAGWSTVFATASGDGDHDFIPLDDVAARQVRVLGTQRATAFGYSIQELSIVGH